MKHRHQSFDEVKKGLEEMESRLSKRADAKEEIVDLQLKLYVNDAEGLGFFAAPDGSEPLQPLAAPGPVTITPVPRAVPVPRR